MTGVPVPAPFSCVIWQHCVSVGQEVYVGSDIISVEIMKMEVVIQTPCSGTITWLRPMGEPCEEGDPIAIIDDGQP